MGYKETKPIFAPQLHSAKIVQNILRGGAVVARWAHNPKVVGSNPAPATKKSRSSDRGFLFMYWVYVLFSEPNNKIYVGFTSDLDARLLSHNELSTKGWTTRFRPWKLIYSEKVETKSEAMKREKELKSHRGRDFIRKLHHFEI